MGLILLIIILLLIYKHLVLYPFKIGKNHLSVFFGIPGSGKTTMCAALALKYQKRGIPTFSNVPIKGCYKFDVLEDLGHYDISYCAVFIDEASICFNNRSWKNFPKELIAWFKMHRHEHCEVFIFSQDFADFDATIKRVAYKWYLCRPALLPFTFEAVPIIRKFGINDQTQKPDDVFKLHHPLLGWLYNRYFFAPIVWNRFNSWDRLGLPKKHFSKYPDADFVKPKKYKRPLKERIVLFFKSRKFTKLVLSRLNRRRK